MHCRSCIRLPAAHKITDLKAICRPLRRVAWGASFPVFRCHLAATMCAAMRLAIGGPWQPLKAAKRYGDASKPIRGRMRLRSSCLGLTQQIPVIISIMQLLYKACTSPSCHLITAPHHQGGGCGILILHMFPHPMP